MDLIDKKENSIWRGIKNSAGYLLLLLGLLMFLIPFIPSTPFLLAGIALLGTNNFLIQAIHRRVKEWQKNFRLPGQGSELRGQHSEVRDP